MGGTRLVPIVGEDAYGLNEYYLSCNLVKLNSNYLYLVVIYIDVLLV